MSAANSKIKFIILLILVILRVHFPCLAYEKPSEHEIKSLIQNLTFKSPLFDKSRRCLVRIGPPAVEYLIRALKDEKWQIRTSAAIILGKIGDKRAVKPLIKSLTDKNRDVRCSAACALGDIKDKNALGPLVETLTDKRWEVRKDAAFVLRKLGDQKAVKPLIQALQDKKWQVREQVAFTLGMIGDKRAVIPLIKALSDKTIEVRKSAVQGLDELRDKRALEPIIQVLKDVNSSVRLYAVRALDQIGGKKAIEPLMELYSSSESKYYLNLIKATLGKICQTNVKPLIQALKHEKWQICEASAVILGGCPRMRNLSFSPNVFRRAGEPRPYLDTYCLRGIRDDQGLIFYCQGRGEVSSPASFWRILGQPPGGVLIRNQHQVVHTSSTFYPRLQALGPRL